MCINRRHSSSPKGPSPTLAPSLRVNPLPHECGASWIPLVVQSLNPGTCADLSQIDGQLLQCLEGNLHFAPFAA